MARYCLGFLCYDGSKYVLARSIIYTDYDEADKRRKEIQPKYKHLIEVFDV